MLKDKTTMRMFGTSVSVRVPNTIYTDSAFPFIIEESEKEREKFKPIHMIMEIDIENKRIIIRPIDEEKPIASVIEEKNEQMESVTGSA